MHARPLSPPRDCVHTRHLFSPRDCMHARTQALGQALGLPLTMVLFTFLGERRPSSRVQPRPCHCIPP